MKLYNEIDFRPSEKLIVTFDKYREFTAKYTVMDEEANKGKDPMKDEMITKVSERVVKFNIQVARVIAVPANQTLYNVGDEVIIDMHNCADLNGYKNMFLIQPYQIIGIKTTDIEPVEEEPTDKDKE